MQLSKLIYIDCCLESERIYSTSLLVILFLLFSRLCCQFLKDYHSCLASLDHTFGIVLTFKQVWNQIFFFEFSLKINAHVLHWWKFWSACILARILTLNSSGIKFEIKVTMKFDIFKLHFKKKLKRRRRRMGRGRRRRKRRGMMNLTK